MPRWDGLAKTVKELRRGVWKSRDRDGSYHQLATQRGTSQERQQKAKWKEMNEGEKVSNMEMVAEILELAGVQQARGLTNNEANRNV